MLSENFFLRQYNENELDSEDESDNDSEDEIDEETDLDQELTDTDDE